MFGTPTLPKLQQKPGGEELKIKFSDVHQALEGLNFSTHVTAAAAHFSSELDHHSCDSHDSGRS